MKATTWKRVSKPLIEVLPGFRPMKKGFVREHEWVAECLYPDSSAYSTGFYLEAFILPLFIPAEDFYFNNGFRVGQSSGHGFWETVDDRLVQMVRNELPELHRLASLHEIVKRADNWRINIHHLELRLCASVILGDTRMYVDCRDLAGGWKTTVQWEPEIIDRCRTMVSAVEKQGQAAGVALLAERRRSVLDLLK